MGSIDAIDMSIIKTSRVNTSPAIGALNIPAMAAEAPQPTSTMRTFLSILNNLPRLLPMAEPVRTIGASAPTEPPKPMVRLDATTEVHVLCGFMNDCFDEKAYRIRVIP